MVKFPDEIGVYIKPSGDNKLSEWINGFYEKCDLSMRINRERTVCKLVAALTALHVPERLQRIRRQVFRLLPL